MTNPKNNTPSNNKLLLKYAGLGAQILISLGIAVWAGLKLDTWMGLSTPLFVLVLPLIVLVALIYQVIKDTSKKK